MDSMKLIKKHGSPGGLPVMTVYIDADAPGEVDTLQLYEHYITLNRWTHCVIVTRESTPFTLSTLAKWLYDNGKIAAGADKSIPCFNVFEASVPTTADNTFTLKKSREVYSTDGTNVKMYEDDYKITYSDGVFTLASTGKQVNLSAPFYDSVITI